jgi:hypothetical protein
MNCLETRQQFVSFWRRALTPDDRRAFLVHLGGCHACDQALRIFALTAPALYRNLADNPAPAPAAPAQIRTVRAVVGGRIRFRPAPRVMVPLAVAIGAALAIYLTASRRVTFEDTIIEYPGVARTTYSPTENLFWPDGSGPQSNR